MKSTTGELRTALSMASLISVEMNLAKRGLAIAKAEGNGFLALSLAVWNTDLNIEKKRLVE